MFFCLKIAMIDSVPSVSSVVNLYNKDYNEIKSEKSACLL